MVREIQIRSALTELKLINVFKKTGILNNQTEVIKMKKITSILLSIIMIYSVCFPITAFAAALPTVGISSLSVKENTVTVKWKKKSKIKGYQIQYSTDSKFKKNKKSIKIKKAKTTSKKISNLKKSKKYYSILILLIVIIIYLHPVIVNFIPAIKPLSHIAATHTMIVIVCAMGFFMNIVFIRF